ncbi:hypothetical protein EJO69_10755 [Flaviflexus salsibiostraticola]|uniref:Uncharacterized protein n=1 Tax=Flaviflexus salsibiostraticola TaxID=1282737 RepID=A0A3S8ZB80_9ACTO|nr:hypothetical protein [Flaviflexus salsibiostraticola]AZN30725.1 hypothetical protein EJO69_10755 [Flaviflexus salsibiostraticola]
MTVGLDWKTFYVGVPQWRIASGMIHGNKQLAFMLLEIKDDTEGNSVAYIHLGRFADMLESATVLLEEYFAAFVDKTGQAEVVAGVVER